MELPEEIVFETKPLDPPKITRRRSRLLWPIVLLAAGLLMIPVLVVLLEPNHIGNGYRANARGDFAEAEREYKLAFKKVKSYKDKAIAFHGLGLAYKGQKRYPEAVEALGHSVTMHEAWISVEEESGTSINVRRLMLGHALQDLGECQILTGDEGAGLVHYARGLDEEVHALGPESGIDKFLDFARTLRARRRYAEADSYIMRAMGYLIANKRTNSIPFALCLEERAILYRESGLGEPYHPDMWDRSAKAIREMVGRQ
jgi:tetratricopeptide (TPR) repeat protein